MNGPVLVDTGPLVAMLLRQDQYHDWAVEHQSAVQFPLLTCEPVLTEASFLLSRSSYDPSRVIKLVRRGVTARTGARRFRR